MFDLLFNLLVLAAGIVIGTIFPQPKWAARVLSWIGKAKNSITK